jgi:hypothetical protein
MTPNLEEALRSLRMVDELVSWIAALSQPKSHSGKALACQKDSNPSYAASDKIFKG